MIFVGIAVGALLGIRVGDVDGILVGVTVGFSVDGVLVGVTVGDDIKVTLRMRLLSVSAKYTLPRTEMKKLQ